ncbi:hypothetical protein [Rhodohalobacter sulfatireducens]|uniref:Outer membrane protein beta-barrel domain-containing protein n=1 Tax=Rhodohalobacter sulfatireducens TaxID=2911366 RepID=A0ABS9KFP5_9BACT|nr:hypothetical protein [Rhodohalobacter sulfatireducens]MCG2589678.1 hypothetical protein [Rhodohalobacter sulfatireducens]
MNSRIMQYMMILAMTFLIYVPNGYAQHLNYSDQLSLSVGASVGYAPVLSFGDYDDSGTTVGIFGDLQYQNFIGQLDFIYVVSETVGSENFSSGMGFFGSLGYKYIAAEKVHIPLMATGGASIIEYQAFSTYKDVSPQVGLTIAPHYILNPGTSIYGAFRYMHGFKGSEESSAIDVMGITVGLRFTLL